MEKAMATHSSALAWKIPWTESQVGCSPWGRTESDMTEATQHSCMHWRRQWQPTPVPGESQGWRSLVGCHLWGLTESDTTEATQQQQQDTAVLRNQIYQLLISSTFPGISDCLLIHLGGKKNLKRCLIIPVKLKKLFRNTQSNLRILLTKAEVKMRSVNSELG